MDKYNFFDFHIRNMMIKMNIFNNKKISYLII